MNIYFGQFELFAFNNAADISRAVTTCFGTNDGVIVKSLKQENPIYSIIIYNYNKENLMTLMYTSFKNNF